MPRRVADKRRAVTGATLHEGPLEAMCRVARIRNAAKFLSLF